MSQYDYIRDYYGVPIKQGASIEYEGVRGLVTGTHGPHVKAKLEGEKHSRVFHPQDLKWLDAGK